MSDRYVATYKFPEVGHTQVIDGCTIARRRLEYAIVFASNAKDALVYAKRLGIAEGAIHVSCAPETNDHNIPKLDPEGWRELQEKIAELNRRMGRPR